MGNKIVLGLAAFMIASCVILGLCKPKDPAAAYEEQPQEETKPEEPAMTVMDTEPEETGPEIPDKPEAYEFGEPLGESESVEDTFFDSAVFLGDSRTEGLQLFSGLAHGDFYWARGMTVFRADDEKYAKFEVDGQKLTLLGALRAKSYESVYIMLGVNELGYAAESYEKGLSALLDAVIEAQPEAVIYLQTLPPVNDAAARENGLAAYDNNGNVAKFNEVIVKLSREKRVVLLDTASVYREEDGQLPSSLTLDGVHFTSDGYRMWADFLRCHVMDRESYFEGREASEQ